MDLSDANACVHEHHDANTLQRSRRRSSSQKVNSERRSAKQLDIDVRLMTKKGISARAAFPSPQVLLLTHFVCVQAKALKLRIYVEDHVL